MSILEKLQDAHDSFMDEHESKACLALIAALSAGMLWSLYGIARTGETGWLELLALLLFALAIFLFFWDIVSRQADGVEELLPRLPERLLEHQKVVALLLTTTLIGIVSQLAAWLGAP